MVAIREAVLALVFVGLIAFWVVYDLAFQKRVKHMFYEETTAPATETGAGHWIEDRGGSRTWVSGTRVVVGGAGMTWDQKMAVLRRHQRISLVLAILVLADMGYSFAIFRREYLHYRASWTTGGPTRMSVDRGTAGGHPHRLWTAGFGGFTEAVPLPNGYALVRNTARSNTGLYLIDTKGKVTWQYEPDDGARSLAWSLSTGLDIQGRVVVAAATDNGKSAFRVFVIDLVTGQAEPSKTDRAPAGLDSEVLLGPARMERSAEREAGRYRVVVNNRTSSVLGFPGSEVTFLDLGP